MSYNFGHWCCLSKHLLLNPLGLAQQLSSLTSPRLQAKTAQITMLLKAKNDLMVQSPTCRNWYVFFKVKYVRYLHWSVLRRHLKIRKHKHFSQTKPATALNNKIAEDESKAAARTDFCCHSHLELSGIFYSTQFELSRSSCLTVICKKVQSDYLSLHVQEFLVQMCTIIFGNSTSHP